MMNLMAILVLIRTLPQNSYNLSTICQGNCKRFRRSEMTLFDLPEKLTFTATKRFKFRKCVKPPDKEGLN